jgi:hypothetical protein
MAVTESRLFDGTHAELNLAAKIPYINLLMPEPTARFLEVTHQRYAQHLGGDLGRWFIATFTDEPSLMSMFLRPMPYRVLPWSPNLPAEFKKRRGYALAPIIPALVAEAGPEGRRWRYDFWRTVGELVAENFFGQIQRWCQQHKVPAGGHLLMEEGLVAHVPLYGDFFQCIRRLDAPSIDCLTSLPPQVPWFIARLLSSAAELEGKTLVMCETSDHVQRYRPAGDQRPVRVVTETEIRGACNRLIISGINTITSYYSFDGLSEAQLQRLNEWIGRCCTMLTGGHQVADIALLYPVESIWPRFIPARHWANDAPAASQIENICRTVAESLFGTQRDFTFVDGQALAEAKVELGALVHGNLRWRVVVLPGIDTLRLAAWENLARFVGGGGVVIAVGSLPANSQSEYPSPRVQELAKTMFGGTSDAPKVFTNAVGGAGIYLPAGSEGLLPDLLDSVLERDMNVTEKRPPLRVTHRRIEGQEVYFVINDSDKPWSGSVSLCATGRGQLWNPATGQITSFERKDQINLSLESYGGMFLRFPNARLPQRHPVKSVTLPGMTLREVP